MPNNFSLLFSNPNLNAPATRAFVEIQELIADDQRRLSQCIIKIIIIY